MDIKIEETFTGKSTSEELLNYTLRVGNALRDIEIDIHNAHGRIDVLEANYAQQKQATTNNKEALDRVERKLEKAEGQREEFNNYIAKEVRGLKETVTELSKNDDARHEEIVKHLDSLSDNVKDLAKETIKNSSYITEAEAKDRQEKYAAEKVEEALAPRKKIKEKVIMTAVGIITVFGMGVLGKLGYMAINLDELVNQAKTEKQVTVHERVHESIDVEKK